MNGQGKMKKMFDKDNDDQLLANGANAVADSVNAEATTVDSNNETECCPKELVEDKLDDADVSDELRPLKKSKSSIDEASCSVEIANGMYIVVLVPFALVFLVNDGA